MKYVVGQIDNKIQTIENTDMYQWFTSNTPYNDMEQMLDEKIHLSVHSVVNSHLRRNFNFFICKWVH